MKDGIRWFKSYEILCWISLEWEYLALKWVEISPKWMMNEPDKWAICAKKRMWIEPRHRKGTWLQTLMKAWFRKGIWGWGYQRIEALDVNRRLRFSPWKKMSKPNDSPERRDWKMRETIVDERRIVECVGKGQSHWMQARWAIREKEWAEQESETESDGLREKENISRERESYVRGQSVREASGDWFREVSDK